MPVSAGLLGLRDGAPPAGRVTFTSTRAQREYVRLLGFTVEQQRALARRDEPPPARVVAATTTPSPQGE